LQLDSAFCIRCISLQIAAGTRPPGLALLRLNRFHTRDSRRDMSKDMSTIPGEPPTRTEHPKRQSRGLRVPEETLHPKDGDQLMDSSMPSSDRSELMEAYLDEDLRFAVRYLATAMDVPAYHWAAVPSLRRAFEVAVVQRRAEELRQDPGWSMERCFLEACHELGVPPETIISRRYRAWWSAH